MKRQAMSSPPIGGPCAPLVNQDLGSADPSLSPIRPSSLRMTGECYRSAMPSQTRLLLISSSNVYGYGYLDHPEPQIRDFLGAARHVLFVPFAIFDTAGYTQQIRERLGRMG